MRIPGRREATLKKELHDWTAVHVRMLEYFEGCTDLWIPDQLLNAAIAVLLDDLNGRKTRFSTTIVEVYYKGSRLLSHRRRYDGQPLTVSELMPRWHRAHAEWTHSRLIHWAEKTGPATGRVVAGILKSRPHPEQGYRACLGLMRLGKRYGADRLEAACERADHLESKAWTTTSRAFGAMPR